MYSVGRLEPKWLLGKSGYCHDRTWPYIPQRKLFIRDWRLTQPVLIRFLKHKVARNIPTPPGLPLKVCWYILLIIIIPGWSEKGWCANHKFTTSLTFLYDASLCYLFWLFSYVPPLDQTSVPVCIESCKVWSELWCPGQSKVSTATAHSKWHSRLEPFLFSLNVLLKCQTVHLLTMRCN